MQPSSSQTSRPQDPNGPRANLRGNQWKALNRFLEDGALEIDNGGAERSLRGLALGSRNWLFAGSDDGARRTAVINSIIESAVMNELEPWHYLSDVIQKLDDGWSQARFDELIPHRWARLHRPKHALDHDDVRESAWATSPPLPAVGDHENGRGLTMLMRHRLLDGN